MPARSKHFRWGRIFRRATRPRPAAVPRMKGFTQFADLASARLGGEVLEANDEFFAPKENLLKASKPGFLDGKYTDRGKWMDGWETRRQRTPGRDWCIIRVGLPGILAGPLAGTSSISPHSP